MNIPTTTMIGAALDSEMAAAREILRGSEDELYARLTRISDRTTIVRLLGYIAPGASQHRRAIDRRLTEMDALPVATPVVLPYPGKRSDDPVVRLLEARWKVAMSQYLHAERDLQILGPNLMHARIAERKAA